MVNFTSPELPQSLQAERAGRAIALSVLRRTSATPIPPVSVKAATGLPGAAGLCAARHLSNCGVQVQIVLDDYNAHTLDVFAQALEVVGFMDLPILQTPAASVMTGIAASAAANTGIVIDGSAYGAGFTTGGSSLISASEFLNPLHSEQWDGFSIQNNPFVQAVHSDGSLPNGEKADALSVAAVRKIDETAMNEYNLSGVLLMENAATGAVVCACDFLDQNHQPANSETKILILAGTGNNGGDGLAMARGLCRRGYAVTVAFCGNAETLSADAAANLALLRASGMTPVNINELNLPELLPAFALVIDGIFGTGLTRTVEGNVAEVIDAVNEAGIPVLALDIPSGINGDSGQTMGISIRADRTVTFAAVKTGLLKNPDSCGKLFLASIGCPNEIIKDVLK